MSEKEILQIHLNSKDANIYHDNTTSNCEWFLPIIEVPQQHTIYISVQHAVIPYSMYNINSSNNLLKYQIDNTYEYNLYIPGGNYNAYELMNFLKSNMNSISNITYNTVTNKYIFLSNYDFIILKDSTCQKLLGLRNIDEVSINKSLTSYNCINLQSHHCICIQSNLYTGSLNNTNKFENNVICSIPINNQPYSMITYTNHNNLKYNLYKNTVSNIVLRLIDQNNDIIDLNGCHWSVSIQFEVIKFTD